MHVLDEARQKAAQARAQFLTLGMRYEAAKALTWEGLACLHAQQLHEAEELLERARTEFAEEGNAVWRGLLKIYLAELFLKGDQPEKALPLATRAQKFFAEQKLTAKACDAQLIQAQALQQLGQLQKALIFGLPDELAPHISAEVEAIRHLFPQSQCFTGQAADRQALTENIADSDVVHIASHAVFRQDNPMFSAFQLAGTWLNFFDICSLRMTATLVTLSGCSAGANRIYAGDELLGLVRGFLSAGAASLVVSLWAVNDPATAMLMKEFYEHLQQGASPRAALRQAALFTRQQFPHPYYWAPFVLMGRTME